MVEIAMPWTVPGHRLDNHQSLWLTLVARLKPGVTATQAQASLAPLWHALRAQELTAYKSASPQFRERFVDKSTLLVKDDSMGFSPSRMDLKTPLNVATLLLLRSAARVREMSMRYALGAKSSRIVRQLLIEGGLLGVAGAAGGLALSPVVAITLVRLLTSADPGTEPYSATVDTRVLLFTLGLSLLVSLLFSIAPALHFLRPDLAGSLRQSTGTASKGTQRFRKAAVGVQIALSVLLLGGAGLFVRTLQNLREQPVGWDTKHVATFSLDPMMSGYGEDRTPQIVTAALDRLGRIPGVENVAGTTDPELDGDSTNDGYVVEGHKFSENENNDFESPRITPGFFATLQQPLLVGRDFTVADKKGSPLVAVVKDDWRRRQAGHHDRGRCGRCEASEFAVGHRADGVSAVFSGQPSHRSAGVFADAARS
jgi:hypothetical protein